MHDKRIVREEITIVFYVNVRLSSTFLFPSLGYCICTVYTTASTVISFYPERTFHFR